MYGRRNNSNRKRKYPYSSKKSSGRYSRRANSAKSYFTYDAPRAKAVTRLNAMLGSELKQVFHANSISSATLNTTPQNAHKALPFVVDPANADAFPATCILQKVGQGPDYNQRIGDKITVKSIDFRLELRWNAAAFANQIGSTAVWIVLDKSPNGVGPSYNDIFHCSDPSPLDQKHMKNENRFTILKTFFIPFGKTTAAGAQASGLTKFMYYKYKKPTIVKYQAHNAAIADVVENQIYIIAVCDTAVAGGNGPFALHYSANIRYYDS